jgi:thiol:disulfide interchange protein
MSSAMRPVVVIGIVFLGVAAVESYSAWRDAHAKELIPWQSNLSVAQNQAAAQHKPVFAYFSATWCGPCQQMKRTTWAKESVARAMQKFVPVKIDIDAQRALAEQYGINGIPAFFVLSDSGQVVRQATGGMSPEEMIAWMER